MYQEAARIIVNARHCVAFTGAGISVESGIPPFRGENGLWNKYDPMTFDISYFLENTTDSWAAIREIFYDLFGRVLPNTAHYALAEMEDRSLIQSVITQNVDNLHRDAGNRTVYEFHGSLKQIRCLDCDALVPVDRIDINCLVPACRQCGGRLKPDVIFFGEPIPEPAASLSFEAAGNADRMILIGTTGTVAPANMLPRQAKANHARIIEINPVPSEYTRTITDVFLQDKATIAMEKLMEEIDKL